MSDLNEQLLPCPFCGDLDSLLMPNEGPQGIGRSIGHPHTDAHYAHCDNCGADGPVQETEPDARAAWNGRAPAAAPAPVAAIKTWQERSSTGPDALGLYPDAFVCMQEEIIELRAALAAAPAAAPIVQPVAWACPLDERGEKLEHPDVMWEAECGWDEKYKPFPLYAAPTPASSTADAKDAAREPDMLWDADDGEEHANSPEDFALNYASNCLRVGEVDDVEVYCAHRASPHKRTLRIGVVAGETEDDDRVEWKWVDAAIASSAGEVKP